jgi:1-deoxy-D-xylulose 5-phosphate reductoisomerase
MIGKRYNEPRLFACQQQLAAIMARKKLLLCYSKLMHHQQQQRLRQLLPIDAASSATDCLQAHSSQVSASCHKHVVLGLLLRLYQRL